MEHNTVYDLLREILRDYDVQLQKVEMQFKTEMEAMKKGIPIWVQASFTKLKSNIATKRKLQVVIRWLVDTVIKGLFLVSFKRLTCHICHQVKLLK